MDIDFYIITLSYLAIILFIHFNYKNQNTYSENKYNYNNDNDNDNNNSDSESDFEPEPDSEKFNSGKYIEELEKSVKNDYEMILNENEINNMKNNLAKNDFMKYLKIEEKDRKDSYKEIINPINKKQNLGKSDLDKYFETHRPENYKFEAVPTTNIDFQKKNLMSDVKNLNEERNMDSVLAFDDFNTSYSTL
jgi:hypothetical protein